MNDWKDLITWIGLPIFALWVSILLYNIANYLLDIKERLYGIADILGGISSTVEDIRDNNL